GSNTDRGIGNIEDRPVVVPVIDLDEVDHSAHPHSIYEVAADAAGQQGERYIKRAVSTGAPHQVEHYDQYRANRYRHQQPFNVAIVQHAESDAAILRVAKVQKAPDHDNVSVALQGGCHPVLRRLVNHNDRGGDQEVPELHGVRRVLAKFIRQLYLPPILLRFAGYISSPA